MEKLKKIATPKRILVLVIFILVLIFAFQNLEPTTVNLIFFSVNIPVLLLILDLYLLGVITGWAVKRNDIKRIVSEAQTETKKDLEDLQKQIKK
ncbi:DUF1049 domain-containing protein (plasmid) [Lactococcus lactis]|uniref:DUF1049 domain-containing protein n=1 Tax=Lactococcus lactis TaxID=1358 RepID=UPI001C1F4B6A|nr:DUF1049 domain-containing protein [Lactococcus lactis]MBU7533110.1 DUF1049 domain-containing protein [Lactococcus lactis]